MAILLLVVLASGCCGSNASGDSYTYSGATPTPAATPSGTPAPTATLTPSAPVPGNVTQVPSPSPAVTSITPVPSPQNNIDPYSKPGWPTYGVNQTLNMYPPAGTPTPTATPSPSPTPVPTGTVYGTLSSSGYPPLSSPNFVVYVTPDSGITYYTGLVSDGSFAISGLRYGTYTIGYIYFGDDYREYTDNPTVVINAANVRHDMEIGL